MLARGEFELGAEIESDTRSLWPAVDALLEAAGPGLRCMRDATRGGVASVLNELARASGVAMLVREAAVPVHPAVAGAAEILGIDPMYVANEGVLVAVVAPEHADAALAALRAVAGRRARGGDRRGEDRAAGDGARGDGVRRQAGHGPARRRPAAADLLRGAGMMATVEFVPNQAETEAITAHVLWMTIGLSLRGRLGGDDLGHQPEPRGHHHGRDPRHAEGGRPQPGPRLRGGRRSSCRPGTTPRHGKLDPFVLVLEGSLGNEKINGDGYWTGFGVNPDNGQPITINEWIDRLAPQGRGGRRRRARARPTAASRR